jgi:nucleoside-diphosphate-sugar epimerase
MHVLVIGAAGMIGRKLIARIAAEGGIGGRKVTTLSLVDVVAPEMPAGFAGRAWAADLSAPGEAACMVGSRPDVIFHLAAIVSGEAEADFDKGYRINLDGTRLLFEAIRQEGIRNPGYCPRVVFTSSIVVFGAPFPEAIPDDFHLTPLTSYGTQKVIGELLLADYSRRGFLDGIGLRLPTICVRPGKPNKAASGFFSSILREPLAGLPAVLPVPDTVMHWHASPRAAVGFLLHAATLDTAPMGARRSLTMPGLAATVAEQIEALRRVAGDKAVALIRREPDETVWRIISDWPRRFDARRAEALGFVAEKTFDEIIRVHFEDELAGKIA